MKLQFYLIVALLPFLVMGDDTECERPAKLMEYEEVCKTDADVTGNTGSFLQQIHENLAQAVKETKRLINIAKKRFGIETNENGAETETKKCEYYQCIFRKTEILGSNNYPNMSLMKVWVNSNVDDDMKQSTLIKVDSCFNALAMNIDSNDEMSSEDEKQTSCDASTKVMMCLNTDESCSTFNYP